MAHPPTHLAEQVEFEWEGEERREQRGKGIEDHHEEQQATHVCALLHAHGPGTRLNNGGGAGGTGLGALG